jgi:hypothetical protein
MVRCENHLKLATGKSFAVLSTIQKQMDKIFQFFFNHSSPRYNNIVSTIPINNAI